MRRVVVVYLGVPAPKEMSLCSLQRFRPYSYTPSVHKPDLSLGRPGMKELTLPGAGD